MTKIPANWRKGIYIVTVVAMVAVLGFGIVTPDELSVGVDKAVAILGAIAGLLAFFNVTPDE